MSLLVKICAVSAIPYRREHDRPRNYKHYMSITLKTIVVIYYSFSRLNIKSFILQYLEALPVII